MAKETTTANSGDQRDRNLKLALAKSRRNSARAPSCAWATRLTTPCR